MVITNLIGGLGNQMFQYAAGRALSMKCGQPLRMDVSDFDNYKLHQGFELQRIFNCSGEIADRNAVKHVLRWQSPTVIRRFMARPCMAKLRSKHLVIEPHYNYWSGIKDVPCDCYINGYWQSEQYFSNITEQIRTDFLFKPPLDSKNLDIARVINQVAAVSLHVRRGDYEKSLRTNIIHGLCPIEYYTESIDLIARRVQNAFFFIFSDDIQWAKLNLKMKLPCIYVGHNFGLESYNDMRLMSMCKHHIIANSSFSWWGAWLNPGTNKIVVTPKQWFANGTNTQDLIPDGWLAI